MIFSAKQTAYIKAPFDFTLDVAEGTPRSSKTTASVFRFARHLVISRDTNHLVCAFNAEQAYKLVMECDGFGLLYIFAGHCALKHDDNGDHLLIDTPSGSKRVYYKGGGKKDSASSIRGMSLGSVYFCEIDLLHPEMIQECFRRTYAAKDRWHIADLNPPAPMHPVIKDVFHVQNTRWTHWTIDDNPIITAARRKEIFETCRKSKYLLERDWYGRRTMPQGVIYAMFDLTAHVLHELPPGRYVEMFFAGDGGLNDATSVSCYVVSDVQNKYQLYRIANWYYSGHDTGTVMAMSTQAAHIANEFIPWCRNILHGRESDTLIDPACKALRAELEKLGQPTSGADNNARDVKGNRKGIEVGIEYLQSGINDGLFYVCDLEKYGAADFIREIGMYCLDNNGHPIDANNHAMDETRYAFNYFYKRYVI